MWNSRLCQLTWSSGRLFYDSGVLNGKEVWTPLLWNVSERVACVVRRRYRASCAEGIARDAPKLSRVMRRSYRAWCAQVIARDAPKLSRVMRRSYRAWCAEVIVRDAPKLSRVMHRSYRAWCAEVIARDAPKLPRVMRRSYRAWKNTNWRQNSHCRCQAEFDLLLFVKYFPSLNKGNKVWRLLFWCVLCILKLFGQMTDSHITTTTEKYWTCS